jgi:hypothetical protein
MRIFKWMIVAILLCMNSFPVRSINIDHWETIINTSDFWKYYVCNELPPPAGWRNCDFNDSSWLCGTGGLGYGDNDDETIIDPCWSILLRMNFTITDTSQIEMLLLQIDFDDSFVAWINGTEIGRYGIGDYGDEPAWNTPLSLNHEALMYQNEEPLSIIHKKSDFRKYLKNGLNVLCLQINNKDINSSDLTAIAYLSAAMNNSSLTYDTVPDWFRSPETHWNSELPLLILDTHWQTIIDEPKIPAHLSIIDNAGMPNNPFGACNGYDGLIGIELRGSSSQMFPKKSYGFETWSSLDTDTSVSLVGLPAENDWVLYGPYTDKTLIRNALAYSLFGKFGHYSPRTRFVEVYINGIYDGIYLLTEKIKRDINRVNIKKMTSEDIADMDLTGGYLLKLDKATGSGSTEGFYSNFLPFAGTSPHYFMYEYPDGADILPVQSAYIREQVNSFENALNGENYQDAMTGYRSYIDVASFVDFFILNEFSKNIDGYRLSTYLYKNRDDIDPRFHAGPVWDYDLAFGNASYAEAQYTAGWQYLIDGEENPIPFWWERLISDPYFSGCLKCRWLELREGSLHTDSINNQIDLLVSDLGDAVSRNFKAFQTIGSYIWPNSFNGETYEEEVEHLKAWITERSLYIDQNLPGECLPAANRIVKSSGFSANIYPNPGIGQINLELQNPENRPLSLGVYNITGQLVLSKPLNSDSYLKQSLALPKGIYQVVVSCSGSSVTLKALVQ